jgi:hypothetical protein
LSCFDTVLAPTLNNNAAAGKMRKYVVFPAIQKKKEKDGNAKEKHRQTYTNKQ